MMEGVRTAADFRALPWGVGWYLVTWCLKIHFCDLLCVYGQWKREGVAEDVVLENVGQ